MLFTKKKKEENNFDIVKADCIKQIDQLEKSIRDDYAQSIEMIKKLNKQLEAMKKG